MQYAFTMQYLTFALVLCLVYFTNAQTKNYCNLEGCDGDPHVACGVSGTGNWASNCVSPALVDLTAARIATILDTHNTLRSQLACGKLKGFNAATRMQTLQWDNELAKLATINVRQCKMNHDSCRSTDSFPYAGQNLAYRGTTGTLDIDEVIPERINAWFNEYANADQIDLDHFGDTTPRGTIGHFTCLVHEKSARVGCAMATYKDGAWNKVILACNYSYTNMEGFPIYATGPTASKCTTGQNSKYPGLCSTSERVDPSPW